MAASDSFAMVLERPGQPLVPRRLPIPEPSNGQVLLRVSTCGVCRTDLHLLDGDLHPARMPVVPGHEIVGRILRCGPGVTSFRPGDRVGVPWLGGTCGHCDYCASSRENLCDSPVFTGHGRDGGYAQYAVADASYCFRLPDGMDDLHAAPLLCAGLIGYRALRMAGQPQQLGIYGFGAAAHLVAQVAVAQRRRVHAFTRIGDTTAQAHALELGCTWAGDSTQSPPQPLDAALIFAPVGDLVPAALAASRKGATVVCAGIHMSDIPSFPYALLWGERVLRSVANLTRADGLEFLELAGRLSLRVDVQAYPLARANEALEALRTGQLRGAAVLDCA